MIYIGIDPGLSGAIAAIDEDDTVKVLRDLPRTLWGYRDVAYFPDDTFCVVEDVCGRPGQSCVANTTFMKYAGYAELLGMTYVDAEEDFIKVKPQTWKKHFGLITKDLTKTQRKHLSIDLAKRLFPTVADQLTASKDGRAEALLIAKYCKDMFNV